MNRTFLPLEAGPFAALPRAEAEADTFNQRGVPRARSTEGPRLGNAASRRCRVM